MSVTATRAGGRDRVDYRVQTPDCGAGLRWDHLAVGNAATDSTRTTRKLLSGKHTARGLIGGESRSDRLDALRSF